jgi:hypothetical protein
VDEADSTEESGPTSPAIVEDGFRFDFGFGFGFCRSGSGSTSVALFDSDPSVLGAGLVDTGGGSWVCITGDG